MTALVYQFPLDYLLKTSIRRIIIAYIKSNNNNPPQILLKHVSNFSAIVNACKFHPCIKDRRIDWMIQTAFLRRRYTVR